VQTYWRSNKCYIFCVFVCSLRYPACNAHAPYCHLSLVRLYNIFPQQLLNGTIFEKSYTKLLSKYMEHYEMPCSQVHVVVKNVGNVESVCVCPSPHCGSLPLLSVRLGSVSDSHAADCYALLTAERSSCVRPNKFFSHSVPFWVAVPVRLKPQLLHHFVCAAVGNVKCSQSGAFRKQLSVRPSDCL
jgi:hypothetical protein